MNPLPPDPPRLPRRDPRGHKGSFGTVAIVGGCAVPESRMLGAPVLAARAALRAGAGLVRLALPEAILTEALATLPEATGIPLPVDPQGHLVPHLAAETIDNLLAQARALVIGPGMGPPTPGVTAACLRAVQQDSVPVIVDADALNALALVPDLTRDLRAPAVFTPHPGEFKRLAQPLRITGDPADPATRPQAALALAQRLGGIVVLKGAGTIVTDGQHWWTCPRGHACLATAGTGDVLAGAIAGLVAQFVRPGGLSLMDAARAAVWAHAAAGEQWANIRGAHAGLLAHELADLLPATLAELTPGAF